jgi:hypothetical protein
LKIAVFAEGILHGRFFGIALTAPANIGWRLLLPNAPSSKLKNLIRLRHFDASVGKMCPELPHGVFFAVNKECTFRAGLLLPSQQLRSIPSNQPPTWRPWHDDDQHR